MAKEEIKTKIKAKVISPKKELIFLSAQDYNAMNDEEKEALDEVLVEESRIPSEYKERMTKLFPRTFTPKPLTWRAR